MSYQRRAFPRSWLLPNSELKTTKRKDTQNQPQQKHKPTGINWPITNSFIIRHFVSKITRKWSHCVWKTFKLTYELSDNEESSWSRCISRFGVVTKMSRTHQHTTINKHQQQFNADSHLLQVTISYHIITLASILQTWTTCGNNNNTSYYYWYCNLRQDHVCIYFDTNFSKRKEGSRCTGSYLTGPRHWRGYKTLLPG